MARLKSPIGDIPCFDNDAFTASLVLVLSECEGAMIAFATSDGVCSCSVELSSRRLQPRLPIAFRQYNAVELAILFPKRRLAC